jgi:ABC-type antimicrobial peptide transport system permease subunit
MSISQYKDLVEEAFLRYPKMKEIFKQKLIEFPKSKDNIPKKFLLIKLRPATTLRERSIFKNNLLNFASDSSMAVFDSISFMEGIESRMGMLDFFNLAISLVCFILGFFQLIVSISANIRDSMWELGVLRAIGMTNHEIMKITIYESFANNLSSIILGFVIGVIVSVTMFMQFLLFLELPFSLIVSTLFQH